MAKSCHQLPGCWVPTAPGYYSCYLLEGCSKDFCGHGRHLCSSKFAVEDGPEHSGRHPSGQPIAGPHAARGVGVAEVSAAAGDVPVAHVEVLVVCLTRGVTSLADDAEEPHNPDHFCPAHIHDNIQCLGKLYEIKLGLL